jgi:hypothetical protein
MKERGNYETIGKAVRLYIKEIRVVKVIMVIEPDRSNHFDHPLS